MKSLFLIHILLLNLFLNNCNASTTNRSNSPALLFEICYKENKFCESATLHSKKGFFSSFLGEPFFELDSNYICALFQNEYSCSNHKWSDLGVVAMLEKQSENHFFVKMSQGANILNTFNNRRTVIRQVIVFFLPSNQKNIIFEDEVLSFGVTLI